MNDAVCSLQIVRVGTRQFAIPSDQIAAVEKWRAPVPLPHSPATVLGIVSIKGRMLTLLDLSTVVDGQSVRVDDAQILVLRGDEQLALVVDDVGESFEVNYQQLERNGDLILGTVKHHDADINILNLKELFSSAIRGRERRRRRF